MRYFARTAAGLEEIAWLDILGQLDEPELDFLAHRQISLSGSYPTIHVLDYGRSPDDPAFPPGTEFANGLNRLIGRDGAHQPYAPLTGKLASQDTK